MIKLVRPCQQASGYMSEEYLSDANNPENRPSIRWRQDFELRHNSPIEFESDLKAIEWLEENNQFSKNCKAYSTGSKIFLAEDNSRELYCYCLIE